MFVSFTLACVIIISRSPPLSRSHPLSLSALSKQIVYYYFVFISNQNFEIHLQSHIKNKQLAHLPPPSDHVLGQLQQTQPIRHLGLFFACLNTFACHTSNLRWLTAVGHKGSALLQYSLNRSSTLHLLYIYIYICDAMRCFSHTHSKLAIDRFTYLSLLHPLLLLPKINHKSRQLILATSI